MEQRENPGRRIKNPYAGSDTYCCFGCAPDNPIGLKLTFFLEGKVVTSSWDPRTELEGYPGVVHGGIQATLADETAAWFIHAVMGTAGLTRELNVTYHRPAKSEDRPFRLEARVGEVSGKYAAIHVSIAGRSGEVFTTAICRYVVFSEEVARKRLSFPGAEAFLDER